MKLRSGIDSAGALQHIVATTTGLETTKFERCIEEAERCCEHARQAARSRRYRAATGLFDTASALYERALLLDGGSYPALRHRLNDIACEKQAYTALARSMSRPLVKS